jgi:2-oxoisovalerate dehydrogenase E2 component (dihydrolipoyl transacylase)
MTIFNLPDLGEGLAEAEIVRWHVNVGDTVAVDQPMLAVETAKAVVEVPAPFSGIVKALHGQPGDVIATGAPLIEFERGSSAPSAAHTVAAGAAGTATRTGDGRSASAVSRTSTADSGTVVGNVPTSDDELIETAYVGGRMHSAPNFHATNIVDNPSGTNGATPHSANGRLRAAPAARALAKKLGIDLRSLPGTGRGGVIIVDDVIAHSNIARGPSAHTQPFTAGEKLRGLRRAMAQSMSNARDNVTDCTIFDDADLHHWREGQDFTTRLLRAIAAACQAEPALNAWFDGVTQNRRLMSHVHIGMAVDTPEGLMVPVIRDVNGRSAAELREEIDRLKRAARDRTVTPDDLRDVTIMLSNFGMIAGRYATPIVVPPTVAILGSGRLSRDVVAVEDRIEAHLRMPLSLTFDHRCVTGGEAARFLAAALRDLEKDT